MRILQISSARTYGGGERHVVDLCRGLQARGHDVFAALRPTSTWLDRLDFLPDENKLLVSIRNSFGVLSAMRIGEFASNNNIDIVHAHVARDYIPTSIACLAAKQTKFVLTRHVLFPMKPFNRFALKNISKAIGVSEAAAAELRAIFPREKVTVIANGIDIENFSRRPQGELRDEFRKYHSLGTDTPLVGTLGELKELKGQRDFVLAAQEILKTVPDCHFVVVGQDNSLDGHFRRELKRLVSVLGMEERFLWLDWLEDPAPFFAAVDVFVSPSHTESFGLAILEAMARGKAVVATETAGAAQLLEGCGKLVPVQDPVALASAITEVLRDPEEAEKLGGLARQAAAEKYSLKQMLDATEAVYRSVLKPETVAAS
ncbi:MAG: glycosyltransferase family 4 protein [Pyrinomonadaceae bacterium]|nr:glycosyltransferase family 4 protein [Pyrinomonadaceae bacterium]